MKWLRVWLFEELDLFNPAIYDELFWWDCIRCRRGVVTRVFPLRCQCEQGE